jgi:phage major head subunit gpT-like protein
MYACGAEKKFLDNTTMKKMPYEKIAPSVMIILSVIASICYGCCGDYRRCTYWAAAAVLNISVTF